MGGSDKRQEPPTALPCPAGGPSRDVARSYGHRFRVSYRVTHAQVESLVLIRTVWGIVWATLINEPPSRPRYAAGSVGRCRPTLFPDHYPAPHAIPALRVTPSKAGQQPADEKTPKESCGFSVSVEYRGPGLNRRPIAYETRRPGRQNRRKRWECPQTTRQRSRCKGQSEATRNDMVSV